MNQKRSTGSSMKVNKNILESVKGLKTPFLLIDLDPQSNLSTALNADINFPSIYNVMKKDLNINDAIQTTDVVDIIISNIMLSGADMEFNGLGREKILNKAVAGIKKKYDFIFARYKFSIGGSYYYCSFKIKTFYFPQNLNIYIIPPYLD